VINTPISEAGFSGLACGAAMNGLHPIVEIMFSSFALVAADQLFNQIGQLAHIYGGRPGIPLVVRMRVAIGLGYGAQHSLDPAAIFSLFPGWQVFAPATAFDYVGLFNAAMQSPTPSVIIEHHELYGRTFSVPEGALEHVIAPGRAKIVRPGRDCTVVAYSAAVSPCTDAASALAREGIEAEVIDLRTLHDAGVDYETIGASLRKTGMLVIVEQAPACNSLGPKISAQCLRRFFDHLDGPPDLVAAPNVPLPVSRALERLCIPTVEDVARRVRAASRREVAQTQEIP
jgi:2-oxoisovalerate dehydrogenase E1 component